MNIPQPTAAQQAEQIRQKLHRVKEIREQVQQMKQLYQEHDALMGELMPLFIEVQDDKFTIHREISLGGETFRFSPAFFDENKGQLIAKTWKSVAQESGSII